MCFNLNKEQENEILIEFGKRAKYINRFSPNTTSSIRYITKENKNILQQYIYVIVHFSEPLWDGGGSPVNEASKGFWFDVPLVNA